MANGRSEDAFLLLEKKFVDDFNRSIFEEVVEMCKSFAKVSKEYKKKYKGQNAPCPEFHEFVRRREMFVRLRMQATKEGYRYAWKKIDDLVGCEFAKFSLMGLVEDMRKVVVLDDEDYVCPICLDKFRDGNVSAETCCRHRFHFDCISKWVMRRSDTCPLCRSKLD